MPIDMSAMKAPPRKTAPRQAAKTAVATKTEDTSSILMQRAEGLQGLGQLAQAVCLMTGQLADARAIGMHWDPLALETAKLAGQYEVVAGPIDALIKVGPFTAVLAAGLPLVMQILTNHKVVDASGMNGVVPPEVLEAQMKAELARMQTEALRQRQAAIEEARKVQAEYEQMLTEERAA